MEVSKIRRFDTNCFVAVVDLSKYSIKIAHPFDTVTGAAKKYNATLAVNMGGWNLWPGRPSDPNEYLVIEGRVVQDKSFDQRPCVEITRENKIVFQDRPNLAKAWNVFGFDRFIARHGSFNERISDRTSVAPRTLYGVNIYGHLVICVAEGRQPDQRGLTFPECWSVMQEFNCTDVGNADGGNSSAMVLNGELLNEQYKSEYRRVVSQFLVFGNITEVPETPQETVMKKFEVIVPVKSRKTPSMFETVTKGNHAVGHTFNSSISETKTETIQGVDHLITFVQNDEDKFWYPMVYKGVAYLVEVGDVPPSDERITHFKDGVTRNFILE